MKLSRRDVVSFFALGVFSLPRAGRASPGGSGYDVHFVIRRLSRYFHSTAAIAGISYMKSTPSEANIEALAQLICPPWSARHMQLVAAATNEVSGVVAEWAREDFERAQIASVSGWLLSKTEARICALSALTRTHQ
jgi:hypothetical protein